MLLAWVSRRRGVAAAAFVVALIVLPPATGRDVFTQPAAAIDFAREVQPILNANCIGCHGSTQQ